VEGNIFQGELTLETFLSQARAGWPQYVRRSHLLHVRVSGRIRAAGTWAPRRNAAMEI